MKQPLIVLTPVLAAMLLATNVRAEEAPADDANWFSLGPQFGLNLNARFKHVGNVNIGSANGGSYADGYVNADSAANLGGLTWNWGYQNAAQVQGGTLTMHRASTAVDGSLSQGNDPQMGFDLAFGHDFGQVLGGQWGLQAAFDFTEVSMSANGPVSGTGTLITDAYALGVVIPPPAPYAGSYAGPGPLIGDSPTRTMGPAAALILGPQKLDAQIYALRAGPYYDYKFCKRWSGRLGGGVSLAVADMSYSFNETISYGSGLGVHNAGSSSGAEFQAGGYLEGKILFALTHRTRLFAGAQYEYLGTFSHTAGNEQAQLDMSSAVSLLLGVEWKF